MERHSTETVNVLSVGDLILDVPEIDTYFNETRHILATGDIVVGQVEVPHTNRGQWSNAEACSAPPADPRNLSALSNAGFHLATLAGNHIFDQGPNGVEDTINGLHCIGIKTVGAGMNLNEARKPAILERNGIRFAFLQYNAVGPRESWATPLKAGGAFIKVSTVYECDKADPGSAPTNMYTVTDSATLHAMEEDVHAAKSHCDIVIAAFHMGRMATPDILHYQKEITHSAIDAGAEMVCCHHSHTLLGIDIYKGKPIFYGLGNFVTVTDVDAPHAFNAPQLRFAPFNWPGTFPYWTVPYERAENVPHYMFTETSRKTIIAKGLFSKDGIVEARAIPCFINDQAAPVPVGMNGKGQEVAEHLEWLNEIEGLKARFKWSEDGNELVIY